MHRSRNSRTHAASHRKQASVWRRRLNRAHGEKYGRRKIYLWCGGKKTEKLPRRFVGPGDFEIRAPGYGAGRLSGEVVVGPWTRLQVPSSSGARASASGDGRAAPPLGERMVMSNLRATHTCNTLTLATSWQRAPPLPRRRFRTAVSVSYLDGSHAVCRGVCQRRATSLVLQVGHGWVFVQQPPGYWEESSTVFSCMSLLPTC